MRNIVVLRDQPYALSKLNIINIHDLLIKSITFDKASSKAFALTCNGTIYSFNDIDDNLVLIAIFNATTIQELHNSLTNNKWFDINFLAGIGSLICISHSGEIISFEENHLDGDFNDIRGDEIGVIDGGILAAAWNPDQSCLVIVTNNNTMLCMSNTWDVLLETPLSSKALSTVYPYISWKGDGDGLSIISVDQEDNSSKLRIYDKQLELIATARNVADGPGSILKGLGKVAAYATNGSYLSVIQERVKGKLQVALIEKNGLRHGDFDLQLPPVPLGWDKWEECSICWDLPSSLIAVGLKTAKDKSKHNNNIGDGDDDGVNEIGIVQLYYRGNYHWYLKQQWIGEHLKFIRFDEEILNRFYISQTMRSGNDDGDDCYYPVIRRVDFTWDISNSLSNDSAVAVVDGNKLLVTPLGKHTIPPPMSKYAVNLQSHHQHTHQFTKKNNGSPLCPPNCTRYANFWIPKIANTGCNVNAAAVNWGLVSLTDDNSSMNLMFGDANGLLLSQHTLSINEIPDIVTHNLIFRSISVSQVDTSLYICLLGSCLVHLGVGVEPHSQKKSDELLVLHYTILTKTNSSIPQIDKISAHLITGFTGQINRIFQVPNNHLQVGLGMMNTMSGEFDIYTVDITPPILSSSSSSSSSSICDQPGKDILVLVDIDVNIPVLIATIPEQCSHLLFIHNQFNTMKSHVEMNDAYYISEPNPEILLLNQSDSITNNNSLLVFSLSLKNRLYCGEYYLSAGVSSFVYNNSFRMLMYATLGARPHLHFSSLDRLASLDPLQHTEDQISFECADPRPLERGSRLVVSVENSSKVIVQLPRGNLECIEPRVLILLRAQHLLLNKKLFECLVLLRKQRVDLNYITDYSPHIFLDSVESMVNDMLNENPDLISLFVTSIEPIDVLQYKYPIISSQQQPQQEVKEEMLSKNTNLNITNSKNVFKGDSKVNMVCTAIRNVLLPILTDFSSATSTNTKRNSTSSCQTSSLIQCSRILQPILCTYAKQRPAELVQALELIRNCSSILTPSSSSDHIAITTTNDLSLPLVQVSIKYLAFLAEGNALFEAALGVCDFNMARAIARQCCQMDPKIYLPLLDSFESIGEKYLSHQDAVIATNAPQIAIMHYKVNIHLKRHQQTVDWFIDILDRYLVSFTNEEIKTFFDNKYGRNIWLELYDTIVLLVIEFKTIVKEFDFFQYTIPKLNNIYIKINTIFLPNNFRKLLNDVELQLYQRYLDLYLLLLNDMKLQYGFQCKAKKDYTEALTAILSTQPMQATYAIEIARLMGNWQLALSIAEKYSCDDRYKDKNELDPKRIAQEIVCEFKQNLDQSSSFIDQVVVISDTILLSNTTNNHDNVEEGGDRILEVVNLCIDYCHDPEEAISILNITQRWMMALQYCMKHNRNDLFSEITFNIRTNAKDMIKELSRKGLKILALVKELKELWQYPDIRLQNVASTDTTLLDELNGTGVDNDGTIDETSSEYSGMTEQSTFSHRSTSSRSSVRSGTSTVSVLSNLSDVGNENKSITSGRNNNNDMKNNTFSISGLEHSLLSRGTIPIDEETGLPMNTTIMNNKKGSNNKKKGDKGYKRDQSERRQKRMERSKGKGYSKDIWGLMKETNICEELLKYIKELNMISKSSRDIGEVLLFLNTCNDVVLAIELQLALNSYMQLIQKNPAPIAPLYPKDWLIKRNMSVILHYQDITQTPNSLIMRGILFKRIPAKNHITQSYHDNNNPNNILSDLKIEQQQLIIKDINRMILGVDTWWDIAAKGIQDWNHMMKATLNYN